MRSLIRALFVAVALAVVLPSTQIGVQAHAAEKTWVNIPVKKLPMTVMSGLRRRYSTRDIKKVERSGEGATALYRVTVQVKSKGKPDTKTVTVDANGNIQ